MPRLGLGTGFTKSGLVTPGVVTDGLVMKHMYPAGAVQPLSDGAAFFDGTDDYIDCGTNASLRTANFTVSCWVYLLNTGANLGIVSSVDNSDTADRSGFSITRNSSDKFEFRIGDSGNLHSSSSVADVNAYQWYFLTQTYDGSTQKGYVDGVLVDSDSYSNFTVSTTNFMIGAYYASAPTSLEMNGYITNVGYWSAVLTQPQIKSIMFKQYADLTTSEKTNLVSFWNLDVETNTSGESGTGGVKDHHGSNHGTLS